MCRFVVKSTVIFVWTVYNRDRHIDLCKFPDIHVFATFVSSFAIVFRELPSLLTWFETLGTSEVFRKSLSITCIVHAIVFMSPAVGVSDSQTDVVTTIQAAIRFGTIHWRCDAGQELAAASSCGAVPSK